MVEGGATEDNQAFASMIDNIGKKVPNPGNGATGVEIRVDELFPADWQTKFYTYPGSLTTPPCSQVVRDESSPFPLTCFARMPNFDNF